MRINVCGARTHILRKTSSPTKERGQVLPLGLVFVAICCVSLLFMFSSGKLVDEKLTVTNAADAAAYSAGIVHARALNYEAYVNRAIIANELAIAQAVSMVSWLRYFEDAVAQSGVVDDYVGGYAIIGAAPVAIALTAIEVINEYVSAWTGGQADLETVVNLVEYFNALGVINIHAGAVIGLRASQVATDAAFSTGVPQTSLAREVARRSDPSLDVEMVPESILALARFTKTYGRAGGVGSEERARLADTVMRSRDEFTAARGFEHSTPGWAGLFRQGKLVKRGGTDLVNFDEWQAVDTMAAHTRERSCGKLRISWCGWEENSIAYAARSETGLIRSGDGEREPSYGESVRANPDTTSDALSDSVDLRTKGALLWTGLSDSQDLRNLDAGADHRVGLSFFVSKPENTSRTAGRNANVQPTGQLAVFDAPAPGNRIASLSRAEVFFFRPTDRPDGRHELANLYSPYWQARLVAPTPIDQFYAATRQNNLTLGSFGD